MRQIKIGQPLLFLCSLLLLPLTPFLGLDSSLKAQIQCSGGACAALPFSQDELNRLLFDFQHQYADELFEDMSKAAALSNLSSIPTGPVNLNGFTIGATATAARVPERRVVVSSANVGTIPDATTVGVAVSPKLYAGINLGSIIGGSYEPYRGTQLSWLSPHRFDIYIVGINYRKRFTEKELKRDLKDADLNLRIESLGAEVRYHLTEGRDIWAGSMVRFLGVSLALGYHENKQQVKLERYNQELSIRHASGVDVVWRGYEKAEWNTRVETIPIEVRTGLQLFYFLNLTAGLGVSFQEGGSSFELERGGPAFLRSDEAALLGIELPESWLAMRLEGRGDVPARMLYGRAGVGLNLANIKINAEMLKSHEGEAVTISAGLLF